MLNLECKGTFFFCIIAPFLVMATAVVFPSNHLILCSAGVQSGESELTSSSQLTIRSEDTWGGLTPTKPPQLHSDEVKILWPSCCYCWNLHASGSISIHSVVALQCAE